MPIYTETVTTTAGSASVTVGRARPTSIVSMMAPGYVAVPAGITGQTVNFTLYEQGSAAGALTAVATGSIPAVSLTIAYNGF